MTPPPFWANAVGWRNTNGITMNSPPTEATTTSTSSGTSVVSTPGTSTSSSTITTTTTGPQSIETDSECLPKYRRDLVAKQKVLRAELNVLQPQSGHCRFEVSRSEIFEVKKNLTISIIIKFYEFSFIF